jgi:hypothetical protein
MTTTTEDFLTSKMFDNAKVGARHRIPISTNFKVAKFFSVSAGGTYEDVWSLETFEKRFDSQTGEVVTDTIKGFDRFNQYSLSSSIGTTVYGTFNFGEDKKLQAIRHIMRPSVSYGWAPSFEQYYDEYINGINGDTIEYSRFQNTLYGAPRSGKSSALSFSLANTLEAKVKDKDSTAVDPKKIMLLNSFNLSTGYNFQADSLNLSPLSLTGGTNILNNKMSINFGANLDPYAIDNNGTRINTFNINNGGGLFRLTSARGNLSYSISSKEFQPVKDQKEYPTEGDAYVAASGGRTDDLFGKANNFDESRFDDRDETDKENPIYQNKIEWDLRLQYAVTYSNTNRQNEISNNSLMFSGNITLSPGWEVGVSSGYDFVRQGFTVTQLRFRRDLKSFKLNFDWTPFGDYERL